MTKREKAEIILDVISENAPVQVDWNMKDLWIKAIVSGLTEIEEEEMEDKSEH